MPIYEYICPTCEDKITETRSITSPNPTHICGKCRVKMNQVYALGGISFKGTGFYSKDK